MCAGINCVRHSVCAGIKCVQVLSVCRHSVCAGIKCVRHSVCAGINCVRHSVCAGVRVGTLVRSRAPSLRNISKSLTHQHRPYTCHKYNHSSNE